MCALRENGDGGSLAMRLTIRRHDHWMDPNDVAGFILGIKRNGFIRFTYTTLWLNDSRRTVFLRGYSLRTSFHDSKNIYCHLLSMMIIALNDVAFIV